jgi:hypothetical protein
VLVEDRWRVRERRADEPDHEGEWFDLRTPGGVARVERGETSAVRLAILPRPVGSGGLACSGVVIRASSSTVSIAARSGVASWPIARATSGVHGCAASLASVRAIAERPAGVSRSRSSAPTGAGPAGARGRRGARRPHTAATVRADARRRVAIARRSATAAPVLRPWR